MRVFSLDHLSVSDHLTDAPIIAYWRSTFRCSLIFNNELLTIVQSFTGLVWPHLRERLKRCMLNITGMTATQTVVLHSCRNVADVFTSFRLHYTKLFARWRTYDGFYSGAFLFWFFNYARETSKHNVHNADPATDSSTVQSFVTYTEIPIFVWSAATDVILGLPPLNNIMCHVLQCVWIGLSTARGRIALLKIYCDLLQ